MESACVSQAIAVCPVVNVCALSIVMSTEFAMMKRNATVKKTGRVSIAAFEQFQNQLLRLFL